MNENENQLEMLSIISQKIFGEDFFSPNKELTDEEKVVVNFIRNYKYKIRVQEPIPDYVVFEDNMNFLSKLPNDTCNLYLDFTVFSQKVKYYESLGYNQMSFYFVELNDDLLDIVSNSENKKELTKLKNDLYVVVKFEDLLNGIVKNYFLFNVRYAERDSKSVLDDAIKTFEHSKTASKFKSISIDDYLTCGIKYDLSKVSEYINQLNNFSHNFNTDILRIGFTYCLGEKLTAKGNTEALYLVSLPMDNKGSVSFFPYYDQGSLEP